MEEIKGTVALGGRIEGRRPRKGEEAAFTSKRKRCVLDPPVCGAFWRDKRSAQDSE